MNTFCRQLSNGYSLSIGEDSSLLMKPCCWYSNPVVFNSSYKETRNELFESITDWTPSCNECHKQEKTGHSSLRLSSKDWIKDDIDHTDPIMLDIELDHECNAACVTCNEKSSSLWAKEHAKLKNTIYIKSVSSVDTHVAQIVANLNLEHLTYVKFFGGEPLFTDTHLKLIKNIPHPENVTLHYTTNGSIYPNEETLMAWGKFKLVIFAASLDGVEKQFDYVRWPLPWSKVSDNLVRLRNTGPYNLMFRVEFTINFLNAYYYDRLENWVNENFATNRVGDKTEINIHTYFGNTWNLENMTDELKTLLLDKYPEEHRIHQLIKNTVNYGYLKNWLDFVDKWDSRRGNDWKHAFPDLVPALAGNY